MNKLPTLEVQSQLPLSEELADLLAMTEIIATRDNTPVHTHHLLIALAKTPRLQQVFSSRKISLSDIQEFVRFFGFPPGDDDNINGLTTYTKEIIATAVQHAIEREGTQTDMRDLIDAVYTVRSGSIYGIFDGIGITREDLQGAYL